jgi:cytochrome bd ubiquinol oxidase subunit I
MQHPVGYATGPNGIIQLANFGQLLLNPWVFWQYLHNMTASVVTASFVIAGTGAFYLLITSNPNTAVFSFASA